MWISTFHGTIYLSFHSFMHCVFLGSFFEHQLPIVCRFIYILCILFHCSLFYFYSFIYFLPPLYCFDSYRFLMFWNDYDACRYFPFAYDCFDYFLGSSYEFLYWCIIYVFLKNVLLLNFILCALLWRYQIPWNFGVTDNCSWSIQNGVPCFVLFVCV